LLHPAAGFGPPLFFCAISPLLKARATTPGTSGVFERTSEPPESGNLPPRRASGISVKGMILNGDHFRKIVRTPKIGTYVSVTFRKSETFLPRL
jgi:hypothetical protein